MVAVYQRAPVALLQNSKKSCCGIGQLWSIGGTERILAPWQVISDRQFPVVVNTSLFAIKMIVPKMTANARQVGDGAHRNTLVAVLANKALVAARMRSSVEEGVIDIYQT